MTGYTIVSPDGSQRVPDEETFRFLKGRRVVILLDDVANLARDNYDIGLFVKRIAKVTSGRYGVAGTCREGDDHTGVVTAHGSHVERFCESLKKFRLHPMPDAQRIELAATAHLQLDPKDVRNYPLPGNITMRGRTNAMAERFRTLDESTRDALRTMKLLDAGGVPITIPRLQTVSFGVFQRNLDQHQTEDILSDLWSKSFLLRQPSLGRIDPNFGVLAYVVSYQEGSDPEDERWDNLLRALENARDMEGLLYLSHGHRRLGDLPRALQTLDGALRIDPRHAEAHFHRAYTLARLGQLHEALEANNQALQARPDYPEAYNNRGYILSRLGQLPDALEALQHALKLRSDFDDAHTNHAIVLARLGHFKEAQEELNTALHIRGNYYAYLNLGITLSRQDAFPEALVAYEQALHLRPDYPVAYLNRGITLARMDRFEQALADFHHAIELRPNYAEAHMAQGQTLASLKRYPEAVQSLNRAIELRKDYAHRATTLAHLEQVVDALADVQYVMRTQPDYSEAHFTCGFILTTIREFDRDTLEQALLAFKEAIRLRPDYPEAYASCGFILGRIGRDEEALAAYSKAMELRPDYVDALFGQARSLCFLVRTNPQRFPPNESFAQAMELLERAVAIDHSTIARISRDRSAFSQLRRDPYYGPRLRTLVWGTDRGTGNGVVPS
jgi:tetratricopeptide (TPR) repeat protein